MVQLHRIRKLERRVFFTLEYGGKAVYAKIVGFASRTAYGAKDDHIYFTVMAPAEDTLISRTTCLRPRNSSTAVLDTDGCRSSLRSSIVRFSLRGIIPPSRVKPDATLIHAPTKPGRS